MSPSYPVPLRALHWLMAAIIFVALALGIWSTYLLPGTPLRVELLTIHKSLGLTALALLVLRVLVRLVSKAPPYRPALSRANHVAALAAHALLYAAMLALPLSGYVHSMAGGHGFRWFGLFAVPNAVPRDAALDAGAGEAHYLWAIALGALLAAHLLAVVWHARVRRDGVLARMWPAAQRLAATRSATKRA